MDTTSRYESMVWERRAKCQGTTACLVAGRETKCGNVKEYSWGCLHLDLLVDDLQCRLCFASGYSSRSSLRERPKFDLACYENVGQWR